MIDVEDLQARLRRFAAERGWEPFHSPKNLATALMVEAAELAEIFQWMTPEASRDAPADAALKQRIGEELADVLLYLLQVADHCRVDLSAAVADKLARNARKYPSPAKAELDRAPVGDEPATGATHVLLDYENVQPQEAELRRLAPEASHVWVFHGPHQKGVAQRFAGYGEGVTPVPISRSGKNALDFHLSFYMGYIAARHPQARMVVVANDQGYSPMLDHAQALGFAVRQIGHQTVGVRAATSRRAAAAGKTAAGKKDAPEKKDAPVKEAAPAKKATPAKKVTPARKTATAAQAPAPKTTAAAAAPAMPEAAPAKKAPAAKQTPAAKKAAPARKKSGGGGPAPAPAPAVERLSQVVEALRRMGARRPQKASTLRRSLKPWLGAGADDAAVEAVFAALQAAGTVAIGAARWRASRPWAVFPAAASTTTSRLRWTRSRRARAASSTRASRRCVRTTCSTRTSATWPAAGRRGAWRRTCRTAAGACGSRRASSASARSTNSTPGWRCVAGRCGRRPGIRSTASSAWPRCSSTSCRT
jgi:NTP pyrophosphatase (non-canonical NTP hydrolase)